MEGEKSTNGGTRTRSSRKHPRRVEDDNDGMKPSKKRTLVTTPTTQVVPNIVDLLNNSLVTEKIASFLTFGDLRTATEVSVDFCRSIRNTRRFQKSAALVLCKTNDSGDMFTSTFLQNSTYPWRAIRVDVTWATKVATDPSLQPLLETCEFLSVIPNNPIHPGKYPSGSFNISPSTFCSLLACAPKLTHTAYKKTIPYSKIPLIPKNLLRLDLLQWNSDHVVFCKDHSRFKFKWQDSDDIFRPPIHPYASSLLTSNVKSLEELCVDGAVWSLDEMKTLHFPLLKKLSATVDSNETQQTLANFLSRHSAALEELDVLVKPYGARMELEKTLFEAIRRGSVNLRKLHLTFNNLSQLLVSEEGLWTFLGSMTKLTNFSLGRPHYSSNVDASAWPVKQQEVLATLPKGQLESLAIQRSLFRDFWGEAADETRRQFRRDPEALGLQLQLKQNVLQEFSALRRLSLFRSSVVDNDLLQFIFTEFNNLEELEVGHCDGLTSEGFTGERRDSLGKLVKFGVSVNNLTRLKHLSVFLHQSVEHHFVLFHKVKMPQLKFFEYLDSSRIPDFQVLTLARNNPSLETVATDLANAKCEASLLADAREEGLRLRRVVNLTRVIFKVTPDL